MKKLFTLAALCLLAATGPNLFSQTKNEYATRAASYASKGDYENAVTNFDAALKYLDVKKVNKNSQEYIKIEKQLAHAKKCLTLSKTVTENLLYLSDELLSEAFEACTSEEEAENQKNSLLAKLETTRDALSEMHRYFPSDKATAEKLDGCAEIEAKINKFPSDFVEIRDWQLAKNENTLDAYRSFCEKYPSGSFASAAQSAIENIEDEELWTRVNNAKTLSTVQHYLSSFPDGIHKEEALSLKENLADEWDWSEAKNKNSTESYKQYMSNHPSGKFLSEAKKNLASCTENDYWQKQLSANTTKAYRSYLSKYPKGKYAAAAQSNINKIAEKNEWDKAVSANTVESYRTYLANSKKKAFAKEANDKIAELEHAREVEQDELRWAEIEESTDYNVFYNYLNNSGYKGHEKEASARYYTLKARSLELSTENMKSIASYYRSALKYTSLDGEDMQRYNMAKETSLYIDFENARSIEAAKSYLAAYPNGSYSETVSDFIAKAMADKLNMESSSDDYLEALSYAKTTQARKYVEDRYSTAQRELKKSIRKSKTESLHFKFGIQGMFYSDDEFDLGLFLGIGNYKNRFNLDIGYGLCGIPEEEDDSYIQKEIDYGDGSVESISYISVSPKINIIKRKYYGDDPAGQRSNSDYSLCALFIAPEIIYSPDLSRTTFGIKVGAGFKGIDFSLGYDNLERVSFGVSLFF